MFRLQQIYWDISPASKEDLGQGLEFQQRVLYALDEFRPFRLVIVGDCIPHQGVDQLQCVCAQSMIGRRQPRHKHLQELRVNSNCRL
ncbi:hypothetical protein KCU88_g455, partial [Aureobasidium melanogenum]